MYLELTLFQLMRIQVIAGGGVLKEAGSSVTLDVYTLKVMSTITREYICDCNGTLCNTDIKTANKTRLI